MAHTLCTFNANNLFARYRFGEVFPGDRTRKSAAEAGWAYLPMNTEGTIELFNEIQRELSARSICRGKSSPKAADFPDILCLQEVESLLALRKFNQDYLQGVYPYAVLLDGRDLRQIDVAVLSKLPITRVRTHIDDPDPKATKDSPYLFSRDCLEVDIELNKSGKTLTLFVNHLKSKFAETAAQTKSGNAKRERQAKAVLDIVKSRFPNLNKGLYTVLGDLNDEPESAPMKSLVKNSPLINALDRISKQEERWTHWYRSENSVGQLDYILLSPELDKATKSVQPHIERGGISFARYLKSGDVGPQYTWFKRKDDDPKPIQVPFQFKRFKGVTPQDYASDHCPVFLEIP